MLSKIICWLNFYNLFLKRGFKKLTKPQVIYKLAETDTMLSSDTFLYSKMPNKNIFLQIIP